MIFIEETLTFSRWLGALRDPIAKAKIASRIRRLAFGNPGDVVPIGGGLSEMRIHYGPGYRVYFMQKGSEFVLLLGGGDKSTQDKDIVRARALAKEFQP